MEHIKYLTNQDGKFLGTFVGLEKDGVIEWPESMPEGLEVSEPPEHGQQVWDGNSWGYPLAKLKDMQKAELASLRYKYETGGAMIAVTGFESPLRINTSTQSQSKIATANSIAGAYPSKTFTWKTLDGFEALSGSAMQEVFLGVLQHVEDCFAREAHYVAVIDAAQDSDDLEGLVFDGWPVSSIYQE